MNLQELLLNISERSAEQEGLNYKRIEQGFSAIFKVEDILEDFLQAEIMFYSTILAFGASESGKESETTAALIRSGNLIELKDAATSLCSKDHLELYKQIFDKQMEVLINPLTYGITKETERVEELMQRFEEETGGLEELLKGVQ